MSQQASSTCARIGQARAVGDEKIADHALAAFIDKEGVTEDTCPRSIAA